MQIWTRLRIRRRLARRAALLRKMFGAFRSFDSINSSLLTRPVGIPGGTVWGAVRDEYDSRGLPLHLRFGGHGRSSYRNLRPPRRPYGVLRARHGGHGGQRNLGPPTTWAPMTEAEKAITFVTFHDANIGVGTEADFAEYERSDLGL